MRTLLLVGSILFCFACDPAPDPGDAGPDDEDGGATTQCEAAPDCDDGAFCNGAERCMPGAADADARGCVAADAPCPAAECDESADSCSCPNPDADGDGDPSFVCGGGDCDDADPRRYSSATEVCDTLGVDEDCDPSTLYNRSNPSSPGDVDGDGHVDTQCANLDAEGERLTGDDCDDGEAAVHPGADERCDAADDDCDELIDETFDCVQNETVSGDNACGRPASRSCDSACAWVEAGFFREEASTTCDYCADSADGLGAETGFATASAEESLRGGTLVGDARCPPLSFFCGDGGDSPQVIHSDAASQVGGVFTDEASVEIGYQPLTFQATVEVSVNPGEPTGGWGIALYTDVSAPSLGDAASHGIDRTREGLSFEWHWANGPDEVSLRRLEGADPVLSSRAPGDDLEGGSATQTVTLHMTPDDPSTTGVDETSVFFRFACLPDECVVPIPNPTVSVGCRNGGSGGPSLPACGFTISPGTRFELGAVAASGARPSNVVLTIADLGRDALCPSGS